LPKHHQQPHPPLPYTSIHKINFQLPTYNSINTDNMHRTYSMRQSRAPTASQLQHPPPPSSSTKANRFFGKANIGGFSNRNEADALSIQLTDDAM